MDLGVLIRGTSFSILGELSIIGEQVHLTREGLNEALAN